MFYAIATKALSALLALVLPSTPLLAGTNKVTLKGGTTWPVVSGDTAESEAILGTTGDYLAAAGISLGCRDVAPKVVFEYQDLDADVSALLPVAVRLTHRVDPPARSLIRHGQPRCRAWTACARLMHDEA